MQIYLIISFVIGCYLTFSYWKDNKFKYRQHPQIQYTQRDILIRSITIVCELVIALLAFLVLWPVYLLNVIRNRIKPKKPDDQGIAETSLEDIVQRFLATYDIPLVKVELISRYIADMRRRFPTMRSERLLRKTAEYFRLRKLEVQ
jgi:hypothetical protein